MIRRTSRTDEAMEAIRARISAGALSEGERLPSIRSLAAALKASPSTVVEAYERLVSEGIVRSRPGSGFYVSAGVATPKVIDLQPQRDRAVDPLWVSRQSLDASPATLRPGCGWLPPAWLPGPLLRRGLRSLARADDTLLADYGDSRGWLPLRQLLARRCAVEGLDIGPDQVMLTSSGSQAVDLICRFLLRPGDAVIVDDPCYFNFRALLQAHRVKIVGAPYTETGPDVARFADVLAQARPRLYITNSAIHNPTGATLTAQTAHKVLTAAAARGLVVVEDEAFADFEPDLSPRLAALDGLVNVIRIGSFSKSISASVRCGYIAARREWIEALVDLQVATTFGGASPAAAQLIFDCLKDGAYRRHMEALRRRLAAARRHAAAALADLGVEMPSPPRGGFHLWGRLPGAAAASDVARAGLEHDVVFAPGDVFSVGGAATAFMRFNVSQMQDPRVYEVLGRALRQTPPQPC